MRGVTPDFQFEQLDSLLVVLHGLTRTAITGQSLDQRGVGLYAAGTGNATGIQKGALVVGGMRLKLRK